MEELGLLLDPGPLNQPSADSRGSKPGSTWASDRWPAEKPPQEAFGSPAGPSGGSSKARWGSSLQEPSLQSPARSWRSVQTSGNAAGMPPPVRRTSMPQQHYHGLAANKGLCVSEGQAEPGGRGGAMVGTGSGRMHCGAQDGQGGGQAAAGVAPGGAVHQGPWDEVCMKAEFGQPWRQHGRAVHLNEHASRGVLADGALDDWGSLSNRGTIPGSATTPTRRPPDPSTQCPPPPGRPMGFTQPQKGKAVCSVPALMDAVDQAGMFGVFAVKIR